MGLSDGVKTLNSVVRTAIIGVFVAIVGFGGYFGYVTLIQPLIKDRHALAEAESLLASTQADLSVNKQKLLAAEDKIEEQVTTIKEQSAQITMLAEKIEKLEIAMRLLKVDHRLAQITVDGIVEDPKTKEIKTTITLQEINDEGNPIDEARTFEVDGREVYLQCWLAKFEDKYVEQNDNLRSTTLCMFKSVYGNDQAPSTGHRIEKPWMRPQAYASGSKMSDFEKSIWQDFWTIANDATKSKELGIRAIHGQSVSFQAVEGKTYTIKLRASDGLSVVDFKRDNIANDKTQTPQG